MQPAKDMWCLLATLMAFSRQAVAHTLPRSVGQSSSLSETDSLANASASLQPSLRARLGDRSAAGGATGPLLAEAARAAVSAEAAALMRSFAVTYQGSHFASLDAASRTLSAQAMTTLTGCACMGQEFDWTSNWNQQPANRECNCLNNAVHEPCGKPLLGKAKKLDPSKYTSAAAQVDETKDICGWSTYYLNRFLDNSPFSLARYNDGEWLAMELGSRASGSGVCPGNVDGLPCDSKFAKLLRDTLDNPALVASTWPANENHDVADFYNKDFIFQSSWDFTRHERFQGQDSWNFKQQFYLIDMIHGLVREHPADLTAWMLTLADKNRYKVTGVGPRWLRAMTGKIPFDAFLEIPPEMRSGEEELKMVDKIKGEISQRLGQGAAPGASGDGALIEAGSAPEQGQAPKARQGPSQVFLISASMMTNVVIADLFPQAKANGAYLIDIGSGFDPLINDPGVHRRTGTDAQELYRNPSDKEVQRMAILLRKISDHYTAAGSGKPPFLEKPLAEIPAAGQLEFARGLIKKWVQ